ncbi:hypothetical protein Nepgr_027147 [Nepenthes gracilis]|uniref:Uncharacterized protein n=1 Tax=Nepenthes gracilis TaxID=150966 RepID=A0AAD3Y2U1_NEPGR|nr:hypothetical protein Nepgr_027147 [Nepenthes gracilis]
MQLNMKRAELNDKGAMKEEADSNTQIRDASSDIINEEKNISKSSVANEASSFSESMGRIEDLEAEIERRKESEAKLFDSYATQTAELEQAMILLEKSKVENTGLREKLRSSEENVQAMREEIGRLNTELLKERENLALALQSEKAGSARAQNLLHEMGLRKNELRLAMEAEEKSKRAMDSLAMALKEVATEANHAKKQLSTTEEQLQIVKEEAEGLKSMLVTMEDNYKTQLNDTKKENDQLKNTADRLRLEALEALLSWNEKEIEFVKCIKKTEEEKAAALGENRRLKESLSYAEAIEQKAKDENQKLRDILKQALNEANVAKEAAGIARAENSQLKDSLAEKDKALVALAQENECLKINEAAAGKNIEELKRVISSGSKKELKSWEKSLDEKEGKNKHEMDNQKGSRRLSLDLKDLRLPGVVPGIPARPKDRDDDSDKDDALTDSIFDLVEAWPKVPHRRRTSSSCTEDGKNINFPDEFDGHDVPQFVDDLEIDRSSQSKKWVLLRKFGDILRRKNISYQ